MLLFAAGFMAGLALACFAIMAFVYVALREWAE
jgi:hypothetical protein